MEKPYQATPDIDVIPISHTIPGLGFLPINSFVIKAKEPVLVDTGVKLDSQEFMEALRSVIDPRDLRWVWLSHDDTDHTGSLQEVLEEAPNARLVVNFVGASRMSANWPVPMNRVYFLNPGESISVGDRKLIAVRPPLYDAPGVNGIYDDKAKAFFTVDSFGAIIPSMVQDAADIPEEDLARGFGIWHRVDMPWVHLVDRSKFAQVVASVRQMAPKTILSSHLPPACGKTEHLLKLLATLPTSEPFVGPNQAALEEMLAQLTHSSSSGPVGS